MLFLDYSFSAVACHFNRLYIGAQESAYIQLNLKSSHIKNTYYKTRYYIYIFLYV